MKSFVSRRTNIYNILLVVVAILIGFSAFQSGQLSSSGNAFQPITLKKGTHISLIGNNLGSRMMNFDHFETEMQVRYPDDQLSTLR